ncbi:MAG: NADP-dependent malic enzyme [bacterium]
MIRKKDALEYHSRMPHGKIEVVSTKPCVTQRDLSLAYTPGVAEPCLEIKKTPQAVYNYTSKGNLVGVITNGTAVLGLGNIGAEAGKPVMEGKGVLFKRFADVNVFDIELDTQDPDEIIRTVKQMEPTFGGINLEDIKAPECFYIEEELQKEMNIPVFHDDQHGTAIIAGAALLNALKIVKKSMKDVKVVINGAGAAGIACGELIIGLGVKRKNIIMCDTKGVIYNGRKHGMNKYKERFASSTGKRTLAQAMKGSDVFIGVSVKGAITPIMVKSMNKNPIIFALANPDPEITYPDALKARADVIMATGRSDFPNQVNNVLGFPFIFRGALDVRAKAINKEMKIAACKALADLAKEEVPASVCKAYSLTSIKFGREYIIPKPFDSRGLLWVAPAVARAAMDSGVARQKINLTKYKEELEARLGKSREIMRAVINNACLKPVRLVFPEGEEKNILSACQIIIDQGIAEPTVLGRREVIKDKIKKAGLDLKGINIIDPFSSNLAKNYTDELYLLRQRKGMKYAKAQELIKQSIYYSMMMLHQGESDALLAGLTTSYPHTIRPALEIIKTAEGITKVAGLYMLVFKKKVIFCADTTVNANPTAEELAHIAILSAETVRRFDIEPNVAMLSFSNFGSAPFPESIKVRKAVEIVKRVRPDIVIDGEMQADTAVVQEILRETYPFSRLKEPANTLIFPDLNSGNIAYKLLARLGDAEAIGPILMGMKKSVHVLQHGASVDDIVNMAAIAVVDAQHLLSGRNEN